MPCFSASSGPTPAHSPASIPNKSGLFQPVLAGPVPPGPYPRLVPPANTTRALAAGLIRARVHATSHARSWPLASSAMASNIVAPATRRMSIVRHHHPTPFRHDQKKDPTTVEPIVGPPVNRASYPAAHWRRPVVRSREPQPAAAPGTVRISRRILPWPHPATSGTRPTRCRGRGPHRATRRHHRSPFLRTEPAARSIARQDR